MNCCSAWTLYKFQQWNNVEHCMYGYSPHYKLTLFNDINSAYKTCKPQIFPHFYLEFGAAEPANGLFRNYRIIFCFLQIFHSNFYYTCAKILKCFYLLVSVRVNIAGSFFWAIKRCDNVIKDFKWSLYSWFSLLTYCVC